MYSVHTEVFIVTRGQSGTKIGLGQRFSSVFEGSKGPTRHKQLPEANFVHQKTPEADKKICSWGTRFLDLKNCKQCHNNPVYSCSTSKVKLKNIFSWFITLMVIGKRDAENFTHFFFTLGQISIRKLVVDFWALSIWKRKLEVMRNLIAETAQFDHS